MNCEKLEFHNFCELFMLQFYTKPIIKNLSEPLREVHWNPRKKWGIFWIWKLLENLMSVEIITSEDEHFGSGSGRNIQNLCR